MAEDVVPNRARKRKRRAAPPKISHVFQGKHFVESGHVNMGMQDILHHMDEQLQETLCAEEVQQWSSVLSKSTLAHFICHCWQARGTGTGSVGKHASASTMAIAWLTGLKARTADRILRRMRKNDGVAKRYGGRGGRPQKKSTGQEGTQAGDDLPDVPSYVEELSFEDVPEPIASDEADNLSIKLGVRDIGLRLGSWVACDRK